MGDNLPRLHECEKDDSAVQRIEASLRRLDPPFAISNATVPFEARDVGGGVRANPFDTDLGYDGGTVDVVQEFEGKMYFSDGRVGPDADLGIDADTFIDDVTEWA